MAPSTAPLPAVTSWLLWDECKLMMCLPFTLLSLFRHPAGLGGLWGTLVGLALLFSLLYLLLLFLLLLLLLVLLLLQFLLLLLVMLLLLLLLLHHLRIDLLW